jgi:hypothetical protein
MESKREKSRLRMLDGIFCSRKYAIKHVERYKGIEQVGSCPNRGDTEETIATTSLKSAKYEIKFDFVVCFFLQNANTSFT